MVNTGYIHNTFINRNINKQLFSKKNSGQLSAVFLKQKRSYLRLDSARIVLKHKFGIFQKLKKFLYLHCNELKVWRSAV